MTLVLGICKDPANKFNKSIYNVVRLDVDIKNATDILRPVFLVASIEIREDHNYVFWGDRKYWCKCTMIPGGLWQIKCEVDPLYSWREQIYQCRAILDRSTNGGDQYLVDPLVQTRAFYNTYYSQSINNTLVGDYLYLITI